MTLSRLPAHCKHCRVKFTPEERARARLIHPGCIDGYAEAMEEKKKAKQEKERKATARVERAKTRQRLQDMQTIPQLIKLAQKEFNAYIRARDKRAGHPCISSGRPLDWSGNGVDAGHYRSVGAAGHLRFDERNVHAQSKHDNQYRAGNVVEYRINLIKRIGLEAVEALEADNHVHQWTREELRQIAATYRSKKKELEKQG